MTLWSGCSSPRGFSGLRRKSRSPSCCPTLQLCKTGISTAESLSENYFPRSLLSPLYHCYPSCKSSHVCLVPKRAASQHPRAARARCRSWGCGSWGSARLVAIGTACQAATFCQVSCLCVTSARGDERVLPTTPFQNSLLAT